MSYTGSSLSIGSLSEGFDILDQFFSTPVFEIMPYQANFGRAVAMLDFAFFDAGEEAFDCLDSMINDVHSVFAFLGDYKHAEKLHLSTRPEHIEYVKEFRQLGTELYSLPVNCKSVKNFLDRVAKTWERLLAYERNALQLNKVMLERELQVREGWEKVKKLVPVLKSFVDFPY